MRHRGSLGGGARDSDLVGETKRRRLGIARRLSRAAKAMALGGLLVSGLLYVLYPVSGMPLPGSFLALAAIASLCASPVVGLSGMLLRLGGLRRKGVLQYDSRGAGLLRPDGTTRWLGHVVSGVMAPATGRVDVQLQLVGGDELSVWVRDEASADALLDLAGVGSERRRTRVTWAGLGRRIGSGAVGFVVAFVATMAIALSLPRPFSVPALFLAFLAPFLAAGASSRWFAWRELEVAADGIAWCYYGRRTLVPLREIASVDVRGEGLVVGLVDGSDRRFSIGRPGLAEGLRRRVQDALSAAPRGRGNPAPFRRGEQSFAQWVEQMQVILRKGSTHRERPVGMDDAVAVLEDPNAEPEARVGAAIALGQVDRPALAARVRVLTDNCVSPKLRVALDGASRGEVDEEIVEDARREMRLLRRV